jgi:branched-subunit amino acid aminotransferase/4-amino-4-deoxychorismate lyase
MRINVAARRSGRRDIWAVARPLPAPSPMRLTRAAAPIATDDRFANKKTFHYGARALAHRAAVERGFETALLLDAQGNVLEAAHGNFFARFADGWVTPPLGGGVLDGIIRAELLQNFPIHERPIPYASLAEAQESCLTNSVRGVAPIVQIDGWSYPVTLANDTWNAVLAPLPAVF